jgi:hypothetical protein
MKRKFIKITKTAHDLLLEESKVRKLRDRLGEVRNIGDIATECIIKYFLKK